MSAPAAATARFSPPVVVEPLPIPRGLAWVARDDLLAGGTKQRAVVPYLTRVADGGAREMVYASPFCGFAQVALAVGCRHLGLRATVFAAVTPGDGRAHAFTALAEAHGARIVLVPSLVDAAAAAAEHAAAASDRALLPLGFDDPAFHAIFAHEIGTQLAVATRAMGRAPRRVWLPFGSGTLTRAFRIATRGEIPLVCVDVGVLPACDDRIAALRGVREVEMHRSPQRFEEPCGCVPPVPSNAHYDAKVYDHLATRGQAGDLWWNVAR